MDHGSVFNRLHSSCDDLQVSYHAGIISRGNINEVLLYSRATTNCPSFLRIITTREAINIKFGILSGYQKLQLLV